MSVIYAMSDIHGCVKEFEAKLRLTDLGGNNRLILLGDYIDYGHQSGRVMEIVYGLQQECGRDKVVVLKGNHEAMFLGWVHCFGRKASPGRDVLEYGGWFAADSNDGLNTFRTLVSEDAFRDFEDFAGKADFLQINQKAAELVLSEKGELVRWLRTLPSFYETDTQIFVHAGVDEEAEDYWKLGTTDAMFLWKHPATFGNFLKTVVSGHIGTRELADDRGYHDVYHDGASHYYIDGSVYQGGKLLLLAYDESEGRYYTVQEDGGKTEVVRYQR